MTRRDARTAGMSRREAVRLLGAGTGIGLATAWKSGADLRAAGRRAGTQDTSSVTFPDGAIVRTVLADVDPVAIGSGATLFHEHLSFDYSSPPADPRRPGTPPPPPPTNDEMVDLLVEELRMAAFDGVSCIVDSSTGPRTQQQIENLTAMATRSGVHVVAGGSYFLRPRYPEAIAGMDEDRLAAHLIEQRGERDILVGHRWSVRWPDGRCGGAGRNRTVAPGLDGPGRTKPAPVIGGRLS